MFLPCPLYEMSSLKNVELGLPLILARRLVGALPVALPV